MTTLRRLLPSGLGGLTGLACALCCAIPLLLAAGILGGAGWGVPRADPARHRHRSGRVDRAGVLVGQAPPRSRVWLLRR